MIYTNVDTNVDSILVTSFGHTLDSDNTHVETDITSEDNNTFKLISMNWEVNEGSQLERICNSLSHGFYDFRPKPMQSSYREGHGLTVNLLVANLYINMMHRDDYLLLTRNKNDYDKASRYKPSYLNHNRLTTALDKLEELGWIEQRKGCFIEGKATRVYLKPGFLYNSLASCGPLLSNVRHRPDAELIELKDRLTHSERTAKYMGKHVKKRLINYEDRPFINAMREDMRQLNNFVMRSDRTLDGQIMNNVVLGRRFYDGRFDCGGRIYGDPMQAIKKIDRHLVRLNGERIVDLDHSGMHVRLLYAHAGLPFPDGDPYTIPGYSRTAIKQSVVTILNCPEIPDRFPRGLKELFPEGTTWPEVLGALRSKLSLILDPSFVGKGGLWQHIESNILVDCLLELTRSGIPYIPFHDGIACPLSRESYVTQVMHDAFYSHVNASSLVTRKVYH